MALQKAPIKARATWRTKPTIPDRWPEKVDRTLHPHIKPIGLISALIEAITSPGDLVVDPAAGSFIVILTFSMVSLAVTSFAVPAESVAAAMLPLHRLRRRGEPNARF